VSQYGRFTLGTGAAPIEYVTVGGGTVTPDALGGIAITNGANITWTAGVATMQADLTGTTEYAVQVGNATGSLTSLGLGLDNQFLRGNTGGAPSWNSVDLTADVNGVLPVGFGGTGITSLAVANTIYVTKSGNDGNTGTDINHAYLTI